MKRRTFIKGISSALLYASIPLKTAWNYAANTLKAGDVFTIAGMYNVNGGMIKFTVVREDTDSIIIKNIL